MLASFSTGSVLIMIGEVFGDRANEARDGGSEVMFDNYRDAEETMTVVSLGLDVVLPKSKMR